MKLDPDRFFSSGGFIRTFAHSKKNKKWYRSLNEFHFSLTQTVVFLILPFYPLGRKSFSLLAVGMEPESKGLKKIQNTESGCKLAAAKYISIFDNFVRPRQNFHMLILLSSQLA